MLQAGAVADVDLQIATQRMVAVAQGNLVPNEVQLSATFLSCAVQPGADPRRAADQIEPAAVGDQAIEDTEVGNLEGG